ncbi:MAG: DUF4158 domain-containing protein [Desulfamplus sp.]|nr:DUF4158 domain-containing protein [Desulfamplus sp.]
MKKHWGETELSESWSLSSEEYEMIESYTSSNRLGVAVQLKYIQIVGSFPRRLSDIPPLGVIKHWDENPHRVWHA